MDQATAAVLISAITVIGGPLVALVVQGRASKGRQEAMKTTIDETAERGKEGRERQEAMKEVIDDTHAQVVTLNGATIGALADAIESRRVTAIPEADRTSSEREHIAIVPIGEDPADEAGTVVRP